MQCPEGQRATPGYHETEASLEWNYVLGETSISPPIPSVAHTHTTELGLQFPLAAIPQGCVLITLMFSEAPGVLLLLVLST